jgi:hypothetical protein
VFTRLEALERNLTQNSVAHDIVVGKELALGEVGSERPFLNADDANDLLSIEGGAEI